MHTVYSAALYRYAIGASASLLDDGVLVEAFQAGKLSKARLRLPGAGAAGIAGSFIGWRTRRAGGSLRSKVVTAAHRRGLLQPPDAQRVADIAQSGLPVLVDRGARLRSPWTPGS